MKKIALNLRVLRELKKLSQEGLANQLNITRARLGAYEEGRNEPPIDLLIDMADFFRVSVDVLIRADLSKSKPEALMKLGKNRILFPVIIDKNNNDCIEVVTAKASAGYLNGYGDPEYIEGLPLMSLPFKVVGKHRTFPIKGDSMLPVKEGSYIVGRYVESPEEIKNGNTYILVTNDEGIVYKRIYRHHNHSLHLHSDNKIYEPYTIKTKDVLEIWEFVCSIGLSNRQEDEVNLDNVMDMLRSMQVDMTALKEKRYER